MLSKRTAYLYNKSGEHSSNTKLNTYFFGTVGSGSVSVGTGQCLVVFEKKTKKTIIWRKRPHC